MAKRISLNNMKTQKLKLVLPNKKYLNSYQNFCRDFIKNGTTEEYRTGYKKQLISSKKSLFLKWLRDDSKGVNLEKGMVQMTTYWAVVNNQVVGRINFRHKLNKALREYGGHIGYAVCPSQQKKGYATQMLSLVLGKIKKLNFKKIMLSCDSDNIGSNKVIEKNGGRLEKSKIHQGIKINIYWIKL